MTTIDFHAHLVPRAFWAAVDAKSSWYGFRHISGTDAGSVFSDGKRSFVAYPKMRFEPEERLRDMDAQGVDVQVLSVHTPLFGYDLVAGEGIVLSHEVNDDIAAMCRQWPSRFAGLATLPMQDVPASIKELERAIFKLGLKGAELDTHVNGDQWDDPKFLPFFQAAESMGAILFFHPQPQYNFLRDRAPRDGLPNSLGVVLDDTIVTSILICSGVLEACPEIRICIAHGGGCACHAMGRLDRSWQYRPDARRIPQPPSKYQRRLYYDSIVGSEKALRFLLDNVGADRVLLGSDWPFEQWEPSPGGWVQGASSLTQEEKDQILWKNAAKLLGMRHIENKAGAI